MRRIWFLALIAVVLLGVIGGGVTMALFTAQTGNATSQFMAGTLQISGDRDNGDVVPGPMFYVGPGGGLYPTGLWAPGDIQHRVLQVENTGSLDAWLKSVGASLDSGSLYLAGALDVAVTTTAPAGPNDNPFTNPGGFQIVYAGSLATLMAGPQNFAGGPLSSDVGDLTDLHFWVRLPLAADNTYQNLTTQVTFSVYAEQKAHNP